MDIFMNDVKPSKIAGVKETDAAKTSRIPIKIIPQPMLRKPEWIRMKAPDSARYQEIKKVQPGVIIIIDSDDLVPGARYYIGRDSYLSATEVVPGPAEFVVSQVVGIALESGILLVVPNLIYSVLTAD